MSGFYLIHRGWEDHPAFGSPAREPYCRRAAWCWMIGRARWQDGREATPSGTVFLRRGQFTCSLRYLARAWGWDEARVRRFLARLVQERMIDAVTDAGQTVITICNYEEYQLPAKTTDAPSDAAATQQRRGGDAKKNEGNEGNQDGDGARARPRERERLPPGPELPLAPPVVAAEAIQIIEAFDRAREEAFGTACEPRFPAQTDRIDAGRWLKAGIEAGMTPSEVVELCRDVFRAVHRKLAARRHRPPRLLAFHDQDIADAIARRTKPMPEGNVHAPGPRPGAGYAPQPRGEHRTYGVEDVPTRRRAILAALAPELRMGRDGHASG